jgi:hypothetical protein
MHFDHAMHGRSASPAGRRPTSGLSASYLLTMLAWAIGLVVFLAIYATLRRARPAQARPLSQDLPWLLTIVLIAGAVALFGALSK